MIKKLKLTRDMVPISYTDGNIACCGFVCPLPKNYEKVINESNISIMRRDVEYFCAKINSKALRQEKPFENILIEYQDRTEEQQLELLRAFRIERTHFDDRGLYAVQAGNNVNSGDIYLGKDESNICMADSFGFRKHFDDKHAFYCHNVDFYWQALLTRELVVKYFNYLQEMIKTLEILDVD